MYKHMSFVNRAKSKWRRLKHRAKFWHRCDYCDANIGLSGRLAKWLWLSTHICEEYVPKLGDRAYVGIVHDVEAIGTICNIVPGIVEIKGTVYIIEQQPAFIIPWKITYYGQDIAEHGDILPRKFNRRGIDGKMIWDFSKIARGKLW